MDKRKRRPWNWADLFCFSLRGCRTSMAAGREKRVRHSDLFPGCLNEDRRMLGKMRSA